MANKFLLVIGPTGEVVDAGKIELYGSSGLTSSDVPARWIQHELKDPTRPDSVWNRQRIFEPDPDFPGRRRSVMVPGHTWREGTRKDFETFLATRTPPELKDIAGRPLKVGSRVAVAFALGRGAEQRVGKIVGFEKTLGFDGGGNVGSYNSSIDPREQIVVEWEESNRIGGADNAPEKSKIFAALRRAVVIGD